MRWFGLDRAAAHIPADWPVLDSAPLLDDALSGGVYGSADMTRQAQLHDHHSGGRSGASRRRGPGVASRGAVPGARRHGKLVSVCCQLSGTAARPRGAQRIWRYLRTRGKDTSAQGSLRIGAQRVELLRQYGVL